jgi:hypothetical protein
VSAPQPPRMDDGAWHALYDTLAARGRADAAADAPPPTDAHLWAWARRHVPSLPERIERCTMVDLRAAYHEGRQPTRIDLGAIVQALRERGYPARVEHTGGNTATLHAGRQAPDRPGERRWAVCAGPGWFERPEHHQPVADSLEFHIGPDSDQATWAVGVPEDTTTRQVADIVTAAITLVQAIGGHGSAPPRSIPGSARHHGPGPTTGAAALGHDATDAS